jgi:hypothetical protein
MAWGQNGTSSDRIFDQRHPVKLLRENSSASDRRAIILVQEIKERVRGPIRQPPHDLGEHAFRSAENGSQSCTRATFIGCKTLIHDRISLGPVTQRPAG